MKMKDGSQEGHTMEITVLEYFVKYCRINLSYSAYLPCLDVGKPKRPNYLPLEVCNAPLFIGQVVLSCIIILNALLSF